MGNNVSVEEKVQRSVRSGDHIELQALLNQIARQGASVKQYLEFPDLNGQTPLIIACHKGYYPCVDLLVKHGANVQHATRSQDTALHEAVSRGHVQIAELLLRNGGNAFLENGRGLTSVDIAINRQHTQMIRLLELRSDFTATLLLKIPRFMGMGAEWKERWCVVMPRYQLSATGAVMQRSLFIAYKDAESYLPSSKVWLDGAIARQVVGSAGAQVLQCGLSLHKHHAVASNVHMTGDATMGYTMHLRPRNGSAQAIEALRRFMDLVNGSRAAAASQNRPASQPGTPPTPYVTAPQTPSAGTSRQQILTDEALARQLQHKYDDELAEQKLPNVSLADRVSQPYSSAYPSSHRPAESSALPAAQPRHQHQPSTASAAAAPLYPNIDMTDAAMGPSKQGQTGGFGASPEWFRQNAEQATAPPASAIGPETESQGVPSKHASGSHQHIEDDDAGQCVVCLAEPATAGFLHGESVHKCCCRSCAQEMKEAKVAFCPMCRQRIEHVILNFY